MNRTFSAPALWGNLRNVHNALFSLQYKEGTVDDILTVCNSFKRGAVERALLQLEYLKRVKKLSLSSGETIYQLI